MKNKEFGSIHDKLTEFLDKNEITYGDSTIDKEEEWVDYVFFLKDPKQMEYINEELLPDLEKVVSEYDYEIFAPILEIGKEDRLRIRIYELNQLV